MDEGWTKSMEMSDSMQYSIWHEFTISWLHDVQVLVVYRWFYWAFYVSVIPININLCGHLYREEKEKGRVIDFFIVAGEEEEETEKNDDVYGCRVY